MFHVNILDLYCGGGGAAHGMIQLGHNVTGIDINPKLTRWYPGDFYCRDVLQLPLEYMEQFDLVWASPPCQLYSNATSSTNLHNYTDSVREFKRHVAGLQTPLVIENVMEAPVRNDLVLCGQMFGLPLLRHRAFELRGGRVPQPDHLEHSGEWFTVAGHTGVDKNTGQRVTKEDWERAMGVPANAMSTRALAQAVPPAYSRYILEHWKPDVLDTITEVQS